MGRRSLARRLNRETKAKRQEPLDIEKWLLKPDQKVTREEAYALLRQWHFEVFRQHQRRQLLTTRIARAVWLIVTTPIRLPIRWFRRKVQRAAERQKRKRESQPAAAEAEEGGVQ